MPTHIVYHTPRHAPAALLVRSNSLPESLLTRLENCLVALEEVTLMSNLVSLGGNVSDLAISHVVDDQGRESVGGKVVEQVTLDDLVGDGCDEVLDSVLYIVSVELRGLTAMGAYLVVRQLTVQGVLGGDLVHIGILQLLHLVLHDLRIEHGIAIFSGDRGFTHHLFELGSSLAAARLLNVGGVGWVVRDWWSLLVLDELVQLQDSMLTTNVESLVDLESEQTGRDIWEGSRLDRSTDESAAEITDLIDVLRCQEIPVLRLLPEQLAHEQRVEVSRKLTSTSADEDVLDPLHSILTLEYLLQRLGLIVWLHQFRLR